MRRANVYRRQDNISDKWQTNCNKVEFIKKVKKLKGRIYRGDFIQVVPSRKMYKYSSALPYDIFDELMKIGKNSPYRFILKFKNFFLIGASPELLLKVKDNKSRIMILIYNRYETSNNINISKQYLVLINISTIN